MPNRPITATSKLMPDSSQLWSKVRRRSPDTVSMPTAAMAKPIIIATTVFSGGFLLMPMKVQKASR